MNTLPIFPQLLCNFFSSSYTHQSQYQEGCQSKTYLVEYGSPHAISLDLGFEVIRNIAQLPWAFLKQFLEAVGVKKKRGWSDTYYLVAHLLGPILIRNMFQ